jgi:hypothetical protein
MRRRVAPLLAGILLIASTGIASASEPAGPYSLDVFGCNLFNAAGDLVDPPVVEPGSEVVLFEGWFAKTRGQLLGFLNNVTWVLTVDGTAVDVRPELTGPLDFGSAWADLFFHSVTVGASGSLETHYDNVLKAASYDGFVHWEKGSIYGGGVDCTVTIS